MTTYIINNLALVIILKTKQIQVNLFPFLSGLVSLIYGRLADRVHDFTALLQVNKPEIYYRLLNGIWY